MWLTLSFVVWWLFACSIDPWGAVIAEVSEGVGLAFAEISLKRVERVRAQIPVQMHKRKRSAHHILSQSFHPSSALKLTAAAISVVRC